ncbi:hypothetical protein KC19_VG299700 [Ceratodon purpureus]|uniref:Uncharacterized protein n=1 Tax=Ceratodon purpureus TaxID=3225 RepID=A0A8T0HV16_CERPU|nr:hypothetical protein KC19_VG299700 [Ceratodon purpureus]
MGSVQGFTIAGRRGEPGDCDGKLLATTSLVWRERKRQGGSAMHFTDSSLLGAPAREDRGKLKMITDSEKIDFYVGQNQISSAAFMDNVVAENASKISKYTF